ncbi:hypothetical protein NLJ89_g8197 [Agrocybe chaxingu]|uniref:Rad4-domain-containing protein n=1 Tax=Agrocybe chaxingu TaxID=84603 RepID=A0A9W8MUQ7_9AGAR|nr:hypothetical protein NLJ89_g8197 [Agrocybe chaxingu]
MSSEVEENGLLQAESDDELDWEEVEVPVNETEQPQHLEITLDRHPKQKTSNKKKGISHADRLIRIDCHKIHTIALIAAARVRNKWINDPLLHARLISLVPLHLQNAFGVIHKSRVPDQNQRGRMFERAINNLAHWWAESFFEVVPEGHIRNQTFDEVQRKLEIRGLHVEDVVLDEDTLLDMTQDDPETIRSEKSLMKHALMQSGSRDTSAQLFTSLCRALGIPARLVVSIQSVPWQASVGKPKPKYERKPKLKGKEVVVEDQDVESSSMVGLGGGRRLDGSPVPVMSEKAKGKQKAQPAVKLRKTKSKGNVLGAPRKLESPDPLTTPPVIWTEVFSRPDAKWLPVDPIRAIVNKRKMFDPAPPATNAPKVTKVENRMVYVLAFEEDGYARDVTRRYAREYGAKVAKVQGGSSAPNVGGGGRGRQAWWDKVLSCIKRPFQLHRDDLEDQELEAAQYSEGMPTTISGFKDHPLYVLERHLKQTETIHPPPPITPELGKFRGEPVYPRSAVFSLKTSENWMRSTGRMIKAGEQPMKMVKVRAGTVNKMRELEVLKDELKIAGEGDGASSSSAAGEIMQGLYAYSQTEPYTPDPVIDGKVPKNNFGNIDLYVPSMLPKGAAHIPFKGVAKIARKLGFDFAEAVTGFEFKKRRAFPILEGVVVAAENEAALLEAFWEAEREADEKARIKKEDRVLKQWTRLIHGLRIRQRLQEQYGSGKQSSKQHRSSVSTSQNPKAAHDSDDGSRDSSPVAAPDDDPSDSAGGFLAGADRVVAAFHLPKNTHVVLPSSAEASSFSTTPLRDTPRVKGAGGLHAEMELQETDDDESDPREALELVTYDLEPEASGMDVDARSDADMEEMEVAVPKDSPSAAAGVGFVPMTMQQMAEEAAAKLEDQQPVEVEEVIETAAPQPTASTGRTLRNRTLPASEPTPSANASVSRRSTRAKSTLGAEAGSSTNSQANGTSRSTRSAQPRRASTKRTPTKAAGSKRKRATPAAKKGGAKKGRKASGYESDSEEAEMSEPELEDDINGIDEEALDDEDAKDGDFDEGHQFSPSKRARPHAARAKTSTVAVSTVPSIVGSSSLDVAAPTSSTTASTPSTSTSGRTLRPRASKTAIRR